MSALPSETTPLNQHSLRALELWLQELGATRIDDDPCQWLLEASEWRAVLLLDRDDLKILEEVCGNHYQLVRDLINVELKESTQVRRSNLMKNLENSIKRNFYEDEEDALNYARSQQQFKQDKVDEWDRTADEYIQLKIEID